MLQVGRQFSSHTKPAILPFCQGPFSNAVSSLISIGGLLQARAGPPTGAHHLGGYLPTHLPSTLQGSTLTCHALPSPLPSGSAGRISKAHHCAVRTRPFVPTAGPVHAAQGWLCPLHDLCTPHKASCAHYEGGEKLEWAYFGMAKFSAVKNWHDFLNTIANFGTTFPDHGIRARGHTKFSYTNHALRIEPGTSDPTVQYFDNSTTTKASYYYVKQGSYLEHDVVLDTTTPQQTASLLKY